MPRDMRLKPSDPVALDESSQITAEDLERAALRWDELAPNAEARALADVTEVTGEQSSPDEVP